MAQPRVGLFVTCLVNSMRPSVGFASLRLLQALGCSVDVPQSQTCCGQPGYNNGLPEASCDLAKQLIEQFESFDYVVCPSGSCAGMLRNHYPKLLSNDQDWSIRASTLASKTYELTEFLVNSPIAKNQPRHFSPRRNDQKVTHHHSCSCLRELGIREAPELLLRSTIGEENLIGLKNPESCCGFGGTFSVKFNEISKHLGREKLSDAKDTGAKCISSSDLGCLLHLARVNTENDQLELRHISEILCDLPKGAPIK